MLLKEEISAIFKNKEFNEELDVDISKISSCSFRSMNECEQKCSKFYGCDTIAYANDILTDLENNIF